MHISLRRMAAAGLAGALLVTVAAAGVPAAAAAAKVAKPDKTSAVEARRVDRVKAPKLDWYPCYGYAECATAKVPLDYDNPKGAKTELALLRVKATDRKNRIGSLFVNPGGPGGSGTALAYAAPDFLSDSVLARFDIVGVDPRGIGFSDNVRCFKSIKEQTAAYTGLNVAFPLTKAEEKAFVASAKKLGKGCSTAGKPLTGAASTAEVARDMDVLRRAVGDKKLSYLGFSYGSVLGNYYANMFPDRVRAVAIDGVVDPNLWVGRTGNKYAPTFDRIKSPDAAYKALRELLVRCDKAGGQLCAFAAGDPVKNFDVIAQRLRAKPVVIEDPELGEQRITYADVIGLVLNLLYYPDGYTVIADVLTELWTLTEPPAAVRAQGRAAAAKALVQKIRALGFPYENGLEAQATVMCTDTPGPKDAADFPALAAASDKRAPYFGRPWSWATAWCARNTWTVQDEDAYKGPFTKRTVKPVLVVGNYWDPATNYSGAVGAAKLLPNSRLLSSDNWGHTAYGTSACATGAIDGYLLSGKLPAVGAVCVGDIQPFTVGKPEAERAAGQARTERASTDIAELRKDGRPAPGAAKKLPPVVSPLG